MDLIKQEYIDSTARTIKIKNTDLELVPVSMPKEYAEKWNERSTDFLALCRNGEVISNSYYRKGGLFQNEGLDFIHIIKYVENYYEDKIVKDPKKKRNLSGQFCLINKEGVETKVFDKFGSSYLICNSVHSFEGSYYNNFTNKLYCKTSNTMNSENYLFLESSVWNENPEREGVFKINKKTGKFTIIR